MLRPILISTVCAAAAAAQERVEFNRDVRPILSNHCYRCHGPDAGARKGKLRLDRRDDALAARRHGAAIVPGDPGASLMIQRVTHADPEERMPPVKAADPLAPREVEVLRRWIAQGAGWQGHWAFEPVRRPAVPETPQDAFVRNDIDRLLLRRLAAAGLRPAPAADPRTLLRRVYLDLTGLPPSPAQVAAFVEDPSEARYAHEVDALLGSVHHAERLTMYWLDLVRYADTCGIHGDQPISMSPYRDWVIRAFHDNMPFDRFTAEQLAGDLLPDATLQQRVASGYNRLNMKTAEGGAQEKEYLAKAAADRVRTTASVWLGVTLGCAECHDHKFDPFTARDFYSFAAFFADLDHRGYYPGANSNGDWGPKVLVPTPAQEAAIAAGRERVAALERALDADDPDLEKGEQEWVERERGALAARRPPRAGPWFRLGPLAAASHRDAFDRDFGPEARAASVDVGAPVADKRWVPSPQLSDGKPHQLPGSECATYLYREIQSDADQAVQLSLGSDDGIKLWVNGEPVLSHFVARGVKPGQETPTVQLRAGRNALLMKISQGGGGHGFYFAIARAGPPEAIAKILRKSPDLLSTPDRRALRRHYRGLVPGLAPLREKLAAARKELEALEKAQTSSLVSKVRKEPRVTRILARGNWQDESGEVVHPAPPAFLPRGDRDGGWGRRELAAWLTSAGNPLTARVFVNRLWKLCFGRGLCTTLDDLGAQGDRPRQLEVLDWLAAELRRDWDVRRVLRLIVMSGAYRQSSAVDATARRRDPENREFARQNRFRIDAELVRDQALLVSGLLVHDAYGPSVKPYQPAGHWAQLNFPKRRYVHDTGPDQYRRGLYTHWQRTFLHPSLRAFDAPSREECTAERVRSNTPLQALVLLNDPTYVEAARVLAARVLAEGGEDFAARLHWLYARVLQRPPRPDEVRTLTALHSGQRARYAADRDAAAGVTTVGLAPQAEVDVVEHAAWTAVTRALFNLHEVITRY